MMQKVVGRKPSAAIGAVMHRDVFLGEFAAADLTLMVLGPPLFGCAIGLLLSLPRRRPALAALGGLVGGTAGAWVGVVVYCWVDRADLLIFEACVLGGLLLGAIPLGWLMAGPKATAASGGGMTGKPSYGAGCAVAIIGGLLSCMGNVLHWLGTDLSSYMPENFKVIGVFGILAGMAMLVFGLIGVRRTREKGTRAESS